MNQVQAELQHFRKDTDYYESHHEELLKKYPEQWVAIFDQQEAGASLNFEKLLDDLQAKGNSVGQVLEEHLTKHDELLILKV